MSRPATIDDVEAISRLAARTFPLACPDHTPAAAIEAHIATELSPQRFRAHLATARLFVVDGSGGEVTGYIMLAYDAPPIPTDWTNPIELRRIYVDAAAQGSGIAADLMGTALREASVGGHDWIWLGTNEQNRRAIRFYEKSAFAIVGERTFRVGDSIECDHVMARTVES